MVKSYSDAENTSDVAGKKLESDRLSKVFSKEFSRSSFLKFVLPSVVSMLVIALYSIVDGIFVANFVNSDALAAINIIYPIMNVVFAFGIMLSVGGCAITAIRLGEGEKDRADKTFSLILFVGLVIGVFLTLIFCLNIDAIVSFLGAEGVLFDYGKEYAFIICLFIPIMILKFMTENFLRTDGRADLSLYSSIAGGLANVLFDYIFIVVMDMGVAGAAYGTGLGFLFTAAFGLIYFISNKSVLNLKRAKIKFGVISNVLVNGSSQMVNELSLGVVTFIFNSIALRYAGGDGVAALTIILYAQFLLVSAFLGFTSGVAPILSYNYGAGLKENLRRTVKQSFEVIVIASISIFVIAELATPLICRAFVDPVEDANVYMLARNGLRLFGVDFLIFGYNVFITSFFTSFNNGKIAAVLSFCRSFLFIVIWVNILTAIWELNGLWLTIPFADFTALIFATLIFRHFWKVYGLQKNA